MEQISVKVIIEGTDDDKTSFYTALSSLHTAK